MIPRLKEKYRNTIMKSLMSKLSLKNIYSVPKIKKVVINMGLGADALEKKKLETCVKDMASITGQQPVITKFKKSISNFKSRKGANAGLKVTLRNDRMYEFVDRLVNIALPRIKDFRGLKDSSCDKFGNFSFGIKEHIIFPEINFDKVERIRGLDVTIVTTSNSKENTVSLLKEFDFPIVKSAEKKTKKKKKFFAKEEKEEKKEK
ncbi:MAG: 50S ribosomal protein L5 [Pelagibacteraceae bacterium TMED124]|nr:MAG: 50S ribosomal protein L5 [Pelagibacteraceae bacterium TMED124]|tara:strand:- start:2216 stop:2830 length:615 start_codon:yes stop_codon:yes gene_type:complete